MSSYGHIWITAYPEPNFEGADIDAFFDAIATVVFHAHPDDYEAIRETALREAAERFPQLDAIEVYWQSSHHLLMAIMALLHDPETDGLYAAIEDLMKRLQWLRESLASDRAVAYQQYLKSEHWKQVRERAIERAQGRCQLCNSSTQLNVHHRSYERLWNERDDDLIVLCRHCHAKFHDKLPGEAAQKDGE